MGMITVKDIFKLIGKSLETVYIRVSGLGDEDEFIKKKVDELIEKTINKLLKAVKVTYVAIHVDTYKKKERGERMKYSVHGRIMTDKGSFFASDHEWEPTKAMKLFLEKIEKEIYKQLDKNRGY
jgi:ribosome-associated translation inhibitor RaiA